jgi:hypothetical protein
MNWNEHNLKTEEIIGTWELQSFDLQEGNEPSHSWGFETHGLLIYAPTGHMSVAINRYAPWSPEGKPSTPAEVDSRNLFYAGTFCIEDGVVKHQVTQASDPDRVGTTLTRTGSLNNEILTLISRGSDFLATLVWKKVT